MGLFLLFQFHWIKYASCYELTLDSMQWKSLPWVLHVWSSLSNLQTRTSLSGNTCFTSFLRLHCKHGSHTLKVQRWVCCHKETSFFNRNILNCIVKEKWEERYWRSTTLNSYSFQLSANGNWFLVIDNDINSLLNVQKRKGSLSRTIILMLSVWIWMLHWPLSVPMWYHGGKVLGYKELRARMKRPQQ